MYFITTKRMLEVCFFQHTPTFIIEPLYKRGCRTNVRQLISYFQHKTPSFEKPGVRGIISLCD